jgi:hypothetical protein
VADLTKAPTGGEKPGHTNGRLSAARWYLLVAVVVSTLSTAAGGVAYTSWSIGQQDRTERENDRRWCQLLTTLDDAYRAAPPQSETGRRLAADIHQLRAELGCG